MPQHSRVINELADVLTLRRLSVTLSVVKDALAVHCQRGWRAHAGQAVNMDSETHW